MFSKSFVAGWGDMDFNSHMRNTAYLDRSADIRMLFFAEHGFPMSEFARLRIGPVVMKDEVEYLREIQLLEEFRVDLALVGLSEDGSRFSMRNQFLRADGKPAARVTSTGGWLSLSERKLLAAPQPLFEVIGSLARTEDFKLFSTSIK